MTDAKRLQEVLAIMVTTLRPWPPRHDRRASVHRAKVVEASAIEQQEASEAARARAAAAEREISKITRDHPAIASEIVRNLRGTT